MNVEKTKVVATRVTKKTAELIAEFCKRYVFYIAEYLLIFLRKRK
jgi:hypothetical protein